MGREMRQGPGGRNSHILQVVWIGRVHRQTKKSRNFQTDRKPHILGDNVLVADKERWGKVGISYVQCNLLFIILLRVKEGESESHSVVSDSLRPHGILQARILEWVAFPFFKGSSQPRDQTQVSRIANRIFIERCLLLGRKAFNMISLDSNSKAEIALLTKVHIVKAMVFPVVMYRCESWIIKKA